MIAACKFSTTGHHTVGWLPPSFSHWPSHHMMAASKFQPLAIVLYDGCLQGFNHWSSHHTSLSHNQQMHFASKLISAFCAGALCTAASAANSDTPVVVELSPSSPSTRADIAIFPVQARQLCLIVEPRPLIKACASFKFVGKSP